MKNKISILFLGLLLASCATTPPNPTKTPTVISSTATTVPSATATPEAAATATELAPQDRLLQLNYSQEYIDKFINIHTSTTELYGNGVSFESITATDASGKEVILAVKWGIPELKKEGVWLQHYKVGRFEILMSPQINGYIDTSKLTEANANAFVKDYLARSKALTGDSRYDNVINNKGNVIVVVGETNDNPFPGVRNGNVYMDNGYTKLYSATDQSSSTISAWFPKESSDIITMGFISKQLLGNAIITKSPTGAARSAYVRPVLAFATIENNVLKNGNSSEVIKRGNDFGSDILILFQNRINFELVPHTSP